MDETVNNMIAGSDKISDGSQVHNAKASENNNNATIKTTDAITGSQQIKQNGDFDIVDFIISHSDGRSVRKKSKLPKILLCVILGVLIVGICALFVIWSASAKRNKLWGTWQASGGVTMTITEKDITINGQTSDYITEEKNVIAIKMNNEYYKIIYKLEGDTLTLTIPDESGVSELKYTRKSD